MAKPARKESPSQLTITREKVDPRRTHELVIAFCGPLGSGVSTVARQFTKVLKECNYHVKTIKISDIISGYSDRFHEEQSNKLKTPSANRIQTLQNVGNKLRDDHEPDFLSLCAIREIRLTRDRLNNDKTKENKNSSRIAYIIESLKHPSEVDLLQKVYGSMFYLVGVLCAQPIRQRRLTEKGLKPDDSIHLIERDRSENETHGQQLEKVLKEADFFVRNDHENFENLTVALKRYMDLILGKPIITPTKHEFAMYIAQSAALNSACLSRQVGAAILSPTGEIVSTGCNDVPKSGGGLYSIEDGSNDMRCKNINKRECYKDEHNKKLLEDIYNILFSHVNNEDESSALVERIKKETSLKDVIEYSRSIHAELDAIISIARNGGTSLKGCSLFSTTFPCHNCARHIIAVGIKEIYYIEPYEKSLADYLHRDSISWEPAESENSTNKLKILHFEGVSPKRYLDLFLSKDERKINGKLVTANIREAIPVVPKYLDTHLDIETKVIQYLHELAI